MSQHDWLPIIRRLRDDLEAMENVTLFCFWASYLVAWVLELVRTRRDRPALRWAATAMLIAGLIAQTAYLYFRSGQTDLAPLIGSPHDWLLVLAWLPVPILIAVNFISKTGLGTFLLPTVLLIVSAAPFVHREANVELPDYYWLAFIHAGMLAIGAAGILLAAGLSVMYLVQHRRLRNKKLVVRGSQLLSLERISKLNWWAIAISVPLLTTGLALGVVLVVGSWTTNNPVPLAEPPFIGVAVLWLLGLPMLIGLLKTRQGGGKSLAGRTLIASGFLMGTLLLGTVLTSGEPGTLHGGPAQQDRAAESITSEEGPAPTIGDAGEEVSE